MILIIGTGGGVAFAADNSKPGDILYALDKGIEEIRLQLENDLQHIVRLRLQFADERIEEITQLIESGETDEIGPVIQEYKELVVAAAPLIVEAHIAGENVQPLLKETNEAIVIQESKLTEIIRKVPIEVEQIIITTIREVEEIRIIVAAPLPTQIPKMIETPFPYPTATDLLPPPTKTRKYSDPVYSTSTATLIPGYTPTGTMIPYMTPTAPPAATPTPMVTDNPYVTTTPTGTITVTVTVTPTGSKTPVLTYTPTPTRTYTPWPPTSTGTPTGTPLPKD
jgi:hypothetical protein